MTLPHRIDIDLPMPDEPDYMAVTVHLVGEAQRGDSHALDALFQRYLPIVRRIAALRMGKHTAQLIDLDDVVQETLADAFRSLDHFDVTKGKFCNWLSQIVENRIRMELRKGNAQKRGPGRELRFADGASQLRSSLFAGAEPTPSQHLAGQETEDRVQACLLEMSERHREVIIQRMICEMSFAEIAEQMGFEQESSARNLYSKALAELRQRVDGGASGK